MALSQGILLWISGIHTLSLSVTCFTVWGLSLLWGYQACLLREMLCGIHCSAVKYSCIWIIFISKDYWYESKSLLMISVFIGINVQVKVLESCKTSWLSTHWYWGAMILGSHLIFVFGKNWLFQFLPNIWLAACSPVIGFPSFAGK